MSNTYTHPYSGQQPGPGSSYPPQQPPGQRFPTYQPRGQGPQQAMTRAPHYFHPAMAPHQGMLPNQGNVYTIPYNAQNVSMSYHIVPQPQQYNGQRPGAPQVMNNAAPAFQPGGQYQGAPQGVPGAQYQGGPHMQPGQMVAQPQNIIYSHGGGPGAPPQLIHNVHQMYGGPRYTHPGHMPGMNMQQVPLSQAPPQAPQMQHQSAPPAHQQQSQQQPQQQQQAPPPSIYQHQPPQHPVVSMAPTSGPPPSTTPQPSVPAFQPQQQQQQPPPQQQQQPPPAQQQQPTSQPPPPSTATMRRERKGIKIVNPDTMEEVKIDNTTRATATPVTAASTPAPAASETSSTSSTPAPEAQSAPPTSTEAKPPVKTSGIATEFAAKVAALAEGSAKKEDSPPPKEAEPATSEEKAPEPVPAEPVKLVKEVTPQKSPSPSPPELEAVKTQSAVTSSLSVTTDMKRDDSLYEPVSPTPLPDSPSDDTSKPVAGDMKDAKPSPFQEVINKKAAGGADKEEKDDGGDFETVKKMNKKKQSAAAKKAALNSKGEKKGDLLDVITSFQDKTNNDVTKQVNDVTDDVEKLSLNKKSESEAAAPEPETNHTRDSATPSDDVAPKVNGVSEAKPDLEDGEIPSDEEEESDQKIKLKYEYAQDQWSPVNPEGKKAYGREFLICLMRDPLSLQKPNNLPNMEIVKDKPNLNQKPQARYDFFTPNFVKGSTSGPRGPQGRRSQGGDKKGRGGDRVDGKPRMVINLPSISAEVKLNKAENAWTPSAKAKSDPKAKDGDKDPKETELQELRRKAIAILNKLTPQKFDTLVIRFQELPIDSAEKLSLCMELVFEKAVDEPSFSVAYASMCGELQKKKVSDADGKEINFRKLLIMRCQQEFEKDYMEGLDREKHVSEMEATTDENEKKKIRGEFEALERKLRKRSLGNIRFIGELYKLGMLTARIMHECVRKLLAVDPSDEESLECLCRLVTTVGQNLDIETKSRLAKGPVQGLCDMSNYFKEMNKLVNDKKTSSRVRFLLQDVVDLERNGWRKRREDAGPKTIDQIHKEVEKEQMEQKLAHMTSSMGPPPARRQDDRRGYGDRNDDRRRSKVGPPGGGQQDGDGWTNVPTKAARVTQDRVDTNRLKNMQSSKVDADQMSFGPPKGGPGGAFGSWGRGSQTKTSRQEGGMRGNMFDALNQGEDSGPGSYQGRGSDGRRQEGGRYAGRSSRDNSQNSGRANALAAAREAMNPRSQSVMGPHPTLSRENSGPAARSHSMVQQNTNNSHQAGPSLLKGADNTDREQLEKWTKSLLDEFLNIGNFEDALQEITEKFSSSTISTFLENVFEKVIERTPKARSQTGGLMANLLSKGVITEEMFLSGLGSLLEIAEDLLVDIPQFWDFIAQIISPVLTSQAASMQILKLSSSCLMSGDLGKRCAAGKYVSAVLHDMAKSGGQAQAASLWASSGLQWSDFLQETPLDQFLKDNKLEWTMKGSEGGQAGSGDRLARELSLLLKNNRDSNEPVMSWIDKNCADRLNSPAFIHLLTTSVVESCIDGVGGPTSQCQLGSEQLKKRNPMLRKYIENNSVLEGEALLALQYLMHRLEHPNKLLHSIFEILYEDDIIGDEAFLSWETNSDPAKQEGKGVALKSCTQFLIFIKEAEADSDNE